MKRLLLATFNQNKVKEITQIAGDLNLEIEFLYLKDFNNIKEAVEDGKTFKDNAIKKARDYYTQTGIVTLAEDSGLAVDALDGEPGVYSARFGGEDKDDYKNNLKLLHILEGVTDRAAHFVCSAALAISRDNIETFEGILDGSISCHMMGNSGFGYDPLFIPKDCDKTLAELGSNIKNKISHRYRAIRDVFNFIKENY
ncbi:MAG: RdgB/HAM1 family non-canonical purine NTP pyrophosphatase [Candidatus Kaelpia aquatica]|nr:RdgB/HAM1 family non-canonical purine NTP pyrophosphatase [Candidatus Kaelpia aquatica]